MNSLIDNYDFNKEAEEIRKRQNKIFSIDNQTKIEDWYKKGLLKVEKRLYEKIQKTYSNLEIRKTKFRNSILRILDELEKEQIENGLNPLFIPIIKIRLSLRTFSCFTFRNFFLIVFSIFQ